jgi:hypothetical protein
VNRHAGKSRPDHRLACERCQHLACVCDIRAAHAEGCPYRTAATCAVAIACDHGFDVCPVCDPCACGAPWSQTKMARRARLEAKLAMSTLASRMHPDSGPLRRNNPVLYWDLRASMDDLRAALCIARGVPMDQISRDGYAVITDQARDYLAAKRVEHGAKID